MLRKKITNITKFSEGKRSIVYTGTYKSNRVIIKKVKNPKIHSNLVKKEKEFLILLNKHKIGPKLLFSNKDYVVMEFIKGPLFLDILNEKKEVSKLIKEILKQCYKLDKLGINKLEFTRPIKHIIVQKNKPVLIDFERCYFTKNPKNVTQFCQFLIGKNLNKQNKKEFIQILKDYKVNKSKKNFDLILRFF